MENKYKFYIENCLLELIDRADDAMRNSESTNTDFDNGHSLAYNEVITFLVNQLEVFDIKDELDDKIKYFIPPL